MIDQVSLTLRGRETMYEKMNTGREMKSLLSQMNLVVPLHLYYQKVEVFPKSECPQDGGTSRSMNSPWTRCAPRGFPPGIGVDPLGKMFPKLVPGKKPPEPDVLIKGNPPQFENLPLRGVPQGKVC
jgi:hypothetical protein